MVVPQGHPRDPVLIDLALTPFTVVRHLEPLTELSYGKLAGKHLECLQAAAKWVGQVRAVQRTLRVAGVDRGLYEGWVRLLRLARDRIERELQRRANPPPAPDREAVRRALRQAMNLAGWDDFGLAVDPEGLHVQILFPATEQALRDAGEAGFRVHLADLLGDEITAQLDIRIRSVTP